MDIRVVITIKTFFFASNEKNIPIILDCNSAFFKGLISSYFAAQVFLVTFSAFVKISIPPNFARLLNFDKIVANLYGHAAKM